MIDCDYCGETHADNSERYPLEGCPSDWVPVDWDDWCSCATGSHNTCPAQDCICPVCNDERL